MKLSLALTLVIFLTLMSHAEIQPPIPLWPDGAPGALGPGTNDIPTLTAYLPDPTNATGAALVICPGGGYAHLAPHEGRDYALWLNQHGVAGFVLKYRLGSVKYLSNELQVTKDTPPCFIWQTFEDKTVPVENSFLFAEALRKAGVPFDLHIYQHGRHGIGLADVPPFNHPHPWAADCLFWLKAQKFVN